jgi:GTP-binding protein
MNAFAVGGDPVADGGGDNGKNRLVVLDMPGYGKGGRAEWGKEILKYLGQRKELKRAFLLIDSEHGIKTSDEQLLALFRQQGIPHQVVLSKVDKVLFPKSRVPSEGALKARFEMLDEMMEEVRRKVQPGGIEGLGNGLGEVIACSAEKSSVAAGMGNAGRLGIDSVRHAMLQAAELEYREPKKKISPVETVSFDDIIWAGEK